MDAGKYNVTHTAGASFELVLLLKVDGGGAYDLTDCTAYAQVRKKASADTVVIELSPSITDATAGEITISATDEVTSLWDDGFWQWDLVLELADGSVTEPILGGSFHVRESVTKL